MGFSMTEVMSGTHEFEPGCGPEGRLPFEFRVEWGPELLGDWINPASEHFLTQSLSGTVSVGGLCQDAPCEGTLELRYFKDRTIRYRFEFEADGVGYRYTGEKVNIKPWNLAVSHTTCFGTLVEAESGRLVSRSVTHFKLQSALSFLTSFRIR